MKFLRSAMAIAIVLSAAPSLRLSAQSDPRLLAAVAQAQQGQGDSARAAVAAILNRTSVTDPLYAEALYTSGRIAANTIDMEHAMRRVAIEFADSPWADNALLQLAELSYANGDLAGAERNLERLRSDYPTSDVLGPASLWAARAYFAQNNTAAGCGWLRGGIAAAANNIELSNQLQFLNGRCASADTTRATPSAGAPAPKTDTTRPAAPPDTSKLAAPAAPSYWSVQVASFATDSQAQSVADMLTKDGVPPHIVRETGGTLKVRAGKFATKGEAAALAKKLKAKYGAVFVVEERP